MAEWKRAAWRKLHGEAITSPSHIGLGPHARSLLLTLFALAWWDEESPEGRLLESPDPRDGTPLAKLARMSELTLVQAKASLERLIRCGTVALDAGVVTLPKFRRWQRGESTERTRRHKAIRDGNGGGTVPGTLADTAEADSRQQTADLTPPTPSRGVADSKPKRPKPARQLDAQAEAVLARIDEHRARWGKGPLPVGQRHDVTILRLLGTGATLDELLAGVDARALVGDRDTAEQASLNATTPFGLPSAKGQGGWSWTCTLVERQRAREVRPSRRAGDETPESMTARLEGRSDA